MMEFFRLFIGCIFISTLSTVGALQCYQCMYSLVASTTFGDVVSGNPNCKDPFPAAGIEVVECAYKCYADISQVTADGNVNFVEKVLRGCTPDDGVVCGFFEGCVEVPGTVSCSYCCEQNYCNSQDIKAGGQNSGLVTASPPGAGVGGALQCHQCEYNLVTSPYGDVQTGDPSCKDPFRATGVAVVNCAYKCYADVALISDTNGNNVETVSRGCATEGGIECGFFEGCVETIGTVQCSYCCEQNNCNNQDIVTASRSTPGSRGATTCSAGFITFGALLLTYGFV